MTTAIYGAYSAYYDLLYREKDYSGEVDFVDSLIRRHVPAARSVLDLGCGTGVHAWHFARRGYRVHGIDQSNAMLSVALRGQQDNNDAFDAPTFSQGDITQFTVDRVYDVVISLFDVIGYLTDYSMLRAATAGVCSSLRPGGMFLFDCWYGPAVHGQRPGTSVRQLEDDTVRVTRAASSTFHPRTNRVDVRYDVFVERKLDHHIDHLSEVHKVRCYFEEELDDILAPFGLRRAFAMAWFTGAEPSPDTWSGLHGFILDGE